MENFTAHGGFMPYGWKSVLWALPAAGVIFSYLGFREATSLAGEVKNPQRAIPLAVIGSVLVCVVLYAISQIAFIGALSKSTLTAGWQHLHFVGDTGPFAGIALTLGLGWLATLVYANAIISPTGAAVIYSTTTARLTHAMSENHYIPAFFSKINGQGVPARAVVINALIGILMLFPFPTWQALIKFQSVAIVLAYGAGPLALIALRAQAPQLKRPFKLPYHRFSAWLTFVVCNLMSYWTGWEIIYRLMIAMVLGVAALLLYRKCRQHNQHSIGFASATWMLPYFGGMTLISYLGAFEGTQTITFGWDFLVIAIYSYGVMLLAERFKQEDSKVHALLKQHPELDV
jgi:amino acid transporter